MEIVLTQSACLGAINDRQCHCHLVSLWLDAFSDIPTGNVAWKSLALLKHRFYYQLAVRFVLSKRLSQLSMTFAHHPPQHGAVPC